MKCCQKHPEGCPGAALELILYSCLVGFTFGWRWVGVILLIAQCLDWLIRVWKFEEDEDGTAQIGF